MGAGAGVLPYAVGSVLPYTLSALPPPLAEELPARHPREK